VTPALEDEIRELVGRLARRLGARGLLNLQLALRGGELFVLEANPRASRTVPFVSKALDLPLVDHACRLLLGEPLAALGLPARALPSRAWAKEAVFPSDRFAGAADRGVEMRSTGEVMAGGVSVVDAYRRALRAAGRSRASGAVRALQSETAMSRGLSPGPALTDRSAQGIRLNQATERPAASSARSAATPRKAKVASASPGSFSSSEPSSA
jgi:carbamoylphosphate synthase large subunit